MSSLLKKLQALEVELHHPGVRCDRDRLDQLLHPDFHEVGRSGTEYRRTTVIAFLAGQEEQPVVESSAFVLTELGPNAALLTYRSANRNQSKSLVRHTLRSSVWVNTSHGWQLLYHQGTPAAQAS